MDDNQPQQEIQDDPAYTLSQQLEMAGHQVLGQVRQLVQQGNVRRIIVKTPEDRVLIDTPLTVGVGLTGALAVLGSLPFLLITTGVAALARVKVEIVRELHDNDVLQDDGHRIEIQVDDDPTHDDAQ